MQLVPSFFLEDKQIRRSQGLMSPIRNEKKYTEKENIMQFEQKILGAESWGTANCWSAEYTNSYRWQREKWHFHYQALDIYLGISQLAPPVISETITDGQSPGVWSKMIEVTCLTSEIKKLNNMCFNLFFFFLNSPVLQNMQYDLLCSFTIGKQILQELILVVLLQTSGIPSLNSGVKAS